MRQARWKRTARRLAPLIATIVVPIACARGDTIWLQSGSGGAISLPGVKITGIADDAVTFTTQFGRNTSKPLTEVPEIQMDDEPAFSAAEEAFRGGDFANAVTNYRKTLDSTDKPWLKGRCALRLTQAAEKAGDFPAAIEGFIDLTQIQPDAAAKNRPAIPAGHPEQLTQAVGELKLALQNDKLSADRKTVLSACLADIDTANGDVAAAQAAIGKTVASAPADDARLGADAKLAEARQELSRGDFAKVHATLDSSMALFTDPAQRADALYLLARADDAAAKSPDQEKDAALAYLRVAAVADALPERPHVADALMAVAAIEVKLNNPKEAATVYERAASLFKGSPAGDRAAESAARLNGSKPAGE